MARRFTIDHTKNWVDWSHFGFGYVLYCLWNREQPMPIGFVWGLVKSETTFEVVGSYVPKWARRLGIRTAINATILAQYKRVVTVGGSDDGGMAFMNALGYKYHHDADLWSVGRPHANRHPNRRPKIAKRNRKARSRA